MGQKPSENFIKEDTYITQNQLKENLKSAEANRRRKILIVEYDEDNTETLKELLQDDYDIEEAANGNEAYELLENKYRELSIIILDLIMPNCDGLKFLKRIKENPILSSIPIVVLAGSFDKNQEKQCIDLGAVDFLAKPSNPEIVKARLQNFIRMRELTASLDAIEFDGLTGLYTKNAFFYYAQRLLDENPDIAYEVAISDIENFRLINLSYGRDKGDTLLKSFADFIATCNQNGICGRYGPDQMISIHKVHTVEEFEMCESKIQEFKENAPIHNIVVKFGVYQNVDRELTISNICDRAKLALKSVKHNYNQTIGMFDGPLSQNQLKARVYESRFHEAIQNKEFTVWYQPKYNVDTKIVEGAEALVRWKAPDRMIFPGEFMNIFESNGLIRKLDEYVFRLVCEYQKKMNDSGHELMPISVNLSRGSLFGPKVVERYKKIVDDCGIDPKYVPLEITESAAVESFRIKEVANAFCKAGFCLHMDDFGSGRSSLNGLNVLPFDVIKLDKSLIDCIGDRNGELILKYTMALAKELGLHLVAEGVENEKQFNFLKENSCDTIQGYYFSKPLPVDEFEQKVRESHKIDLQNHSIKKNYSLVSEEEIDQHAMVRMLQQIPGGFFSYEAEGNERILASNSYVWNLFGCDSEEMFLEHVHGSFNGIVAPEELERVHQSITNQVEDGKNRMDYVEYNIVRRDGTRVPVVDYGQLCYQDGKKVFYVFINEAE